MKSRHCIFFLLATLTSFSAFGQSINGTPNSVRATNTLEGLSDGLSTRESLIGIPIPPGEVIGDFYLDVNWKKTSIVLSKTEKLVQDQSCRYNIKTDQLEVNADKGVIGVPGSKIKLFSFFDSQNRPVNFINAGQYTLKGVKLTGFLCTLVEGKISFFKRTTLVIQEANYTPALNIGSRDTKILKKDIYYYSFNNELIELKKGKNNFLEIFGPSSEIDEFVKVNNLDVNSENHRIQVFEYFNQLNK